MSTFEEDQKSYDRCLSALGRGEVAEAIIQVEKISMEAMRDIAKNQVEIFQETRACLKNNNSAQAAIHATGLLGDAKLFFIEALGPAMAQARRTLYKRAYRASPGPRDKDNTPPETNKPIDQQPHVEEKPTTTRASTPTEPLSDFSTSVRKEVSHLFGTALYAEESDALKTKILVAAACLEAAARDEQLSYQDIASRIKCHIVDVRQSILFLQTSIQKQSRWELYFNDKIVQFRRKKQTST